MRKNWLILLAFAAAVICIPVVKPLVAGQRESTPAPDHSLAGIDGVLGRLPVLVAFTYNGECCDSTRLFFDEFNRRVDLIAGPFGEQLTVIWADVSVETESYRRALEDLARTYSVRRLPSCLVVDARGQAVGIIEGMPSDDRLHNAIARAVEGQ